MGTPGASDAEPVATRLVPEPALRAWVEDRLPGTGRFTVERVTTGMSNELFRISRADASFVLRRPPERRHGAVSSTSLDREFTVMQSLDGTGVPHATPLLLCSDPNVIGAPFLIMEEIDGVRLYDALPPQYDTSAARGDLGRELVGGLAALHSLDWQAAGLTSLGRPDGFTERQVDRWLRQLESFGTRDFSHLQVPMTALRNRTPVMQRAALIHGDYGLHNVLFPHSPGPLRAVLDWETATVGDPLMDAGYFLSMWLSEPEKTMWGASGLPYDVTGFADRSELVGQYAEATGLDVSDLHWYQAVAQLKMAAMLEGGYVRYLRGGADGASFATLGEDVLNHVAYALHLTELALSTP